MSLANDAARVMMARRMVWTLLLSGRTIAHALAPLPVNPAPSSFALKPSAASLSKNLLAHEEELAESLALGYERPRGAAAVERAAPQTRRWLVDRSALGMGAACPFAPNECGVVATTDPLFSVTECTAIREEAAEHIAAGSGGSTFTMVDTNRDVAVHAMPRAQSWLNRVGLPRVARLAASCFGSGVGDPGNLFVYRALVINYDAAAGLTRQPVHRDGCLLSVTIPLSDASEYTGGGTYVEALGRSIRVDRGHALMQPGALRHSGNHIERGERWVLVLFLGTLRMRHGEHTRRFKERASDLGDQGDTVGELTNLRHALSASGAADHEVLYDVGAHYFDIGHVETAMHWYEQALNLQPHDPLVLTSLGTCHVELDQPLAAFRCFRRALKAEPHHLPALLPALEVLEAVERFRGCAALLARAPSSAVRAHPELGAWAARYVST